jgi:hypothetical protein
MVLVVYKKDLANFFGNAIQFFSTGVDAERLETTATDPSTWNEPLGVDSTMNAARSHKILPSRGRRDLRAEALEAQSAPLAKDSYSRLSPLLGNSGS